MNEITSRAELDAIEERAKKAAEKYIKEDVGEADVSVLGVVRTVYVLAYFEGYTDARLGLE